MLPLCLAQKKCLLLESAHKMQSLQPELRLAVPFNISISATIDEMLPAKRAANCRERYVKSLNFYLRQFAKGREQRPLAEFTSAEIEDWMNKYPCPWSRRSWLSRLGALFSFALRRGHIAANPCKRIEGVRVDIAPPKILTPAQADLILQICPSICRPYLILGLFAGIRPEEIMRLDWSAIDLETKTVRVDGKTRRRRIVNLEPKAVALLSGCPLQRGPVSPSLSTLRRFKRRALAALGLARWPQDLLRHTAASYLLALHQDAGKVATMLGNSSAILLTHYHEPVRNGDCREFWRKKQKKRKKSRKSKKRRSRIRLQAF